MCIQWKDGGQGLCDMTGLRSKEKTGDKGVYPTEIQKVLGSSSLKWIRDLNTPLFMHADSKIHHEKHSCQSSWCQKTCEDVQKITLPSKKHHGISSAIEMGEAFWFCLKHPAVFQLLQGMVRWIPRHERHWSAISRRSSRVRPSQGMVSKGWITRVRRSDSRGRWGQRIGRLVHQHSHHQNIIVLYLCQDMFPPRKYAKSISWNAHYIIAFKSSRDQLGMKNLLL